MKTIALAALLAGGTAVLIACVSRPAEAAREARARYEYNRIAREFVMPAAAATNEMARALLWKRAERGYESIQRQYPDTQPWAAMSLRSLGNLYRKQGAFAEALAAYTKVGALYPEQDWEVAQAWKAAGDLLWERGLKTEAAPYYRNLIARFDKPGQHPMFETLVLIARSRLSELKP